MVVERGSVEENQRQEFMGRGVDCALTYGMCSEMYDKHKEHTTTLEESRKIIVIPQFFCELNRKARCLASRSLSLHFTPHKRLKGAMFVSFAQR